MAKGRRKKSEAPQWLKVEGQWVKVRVTHCKPVAWTRGLKCGGWDKHATVDMSRRGEIHVTRPVRTETYAGPLHGSLPAPKVEA